MNPPSNLTFLLNDETIELHDASATCTLLNFIREQKQLTGSKEGCAEGDCGACTVLIGRLLRGQLIYESVNACIRLLPSVQGCHVVTIEHLQSVDAEGLHPVQQAMVDEHASQCGFCTPGIVMSLYALWMENPNPDRETIVRSLQGNLCRCTGYAPIIRAAVTASLQATQNRDSLFTARKQVSEKLLSLQMTERLTFAFDDQLFIHPASEQDLGEVLAEHTNATIVAGSTDVGLWVNKHFTDISPVVSIAHIDDLHRIEQTPESTTLGACVTYSEALTYLSSEFPPLREYWYRIGGEQVRNMGTIGGNIANGSPIGDTPAPLIALGATLIVRSRDGQREMPLEDFFVDYKKQDLQPGEYVAAISIPSLPSVKTQNNNQHFFAAYKISKRFDEDISTLCCGLYIEVTEGEITRARIAFGGMAGTPKRAAVTEAALLGQPWQHDSMINASNCIKDDFTPLSDARGSSAYRLSVARNLLQRFYAEQSSNEDSSDKADSKPQAPVRLNRGSTV